MPKSNYTIEDELSIMASEKGCDREMDYVDCESCDSYESCLERAKENVETYEKIKLKQTIK